MNSFDPNIIQARICYEFKNPKLLEAAFTHASYVNEHDGTANERIEFLGDCVLNFLVGERMFKQDPSAKEGDLSERRAALVSRAPLARIIDDLGLLEYLRVGVGVDKSAFSVKARSDVFEAMVGAVYLDGGIDACETLLDNIYYDKVIPEYDYKSALQKLAAALGYEVSYDTVSGKGGFITTVTVDNKKFIGEGRSKRLSQIDAAKKALIRLKPE